jgi:hypothetical protein
MAPIVIGELHDTPNRQACKLDKVFKEWNVADCWTELSFAELFSVTSNTTPITASAHLKDVHVHPGNARRMYPYYIIESILDIGVFVAPYASIGARLHPDTRKTIKQFEKRMFEAMDHRRTTINLIMSIIDPSRELPKWYQDFLERYKEIGFGIQDTSNPVHEALNALTPELRNKILAFAKKHVEQLVQVDTEDYSRAMESVERTRRTDSPHLVTTKYDKIRSFFISLFAIIMDVYILARIFDSSTNHAVVCGFNHMQRLFEFFKDGTFIRSGWTAFSDNTSYVDLDADRRSYRH